MRLAARARRWPPAEPALDSDAIATFGRSRASSGLEPGGAAAAKRGSGRDRVPSEATGVALLSPQRWRRYASVQRRGRRGSAELLGPRPGTATRPQHDGNGVGVD